jgi:hypothetical protein
MTDCERLSDRMPEVAMARAAWSAEEAAHLASCTECRGEWDLVLAARRLEARAPATDVDAIAAAVQHRLTADRTGRRRTRRFWAAGGSAAAAAAAIAIAHGTGRAPGPEAGPEVVAQAEALVPLPELEGLATAQLDTLLQALEGPLAGSSTLESSTMSDDVDAELERILDTWEG